MYKFFKYLLVILIILYPVFIYFGLSYSSPAQIGLLLLCLFLARAFFIARDRLAQAWPLVMTVLIGAGLAGATWLLDTTAWLLWYPVAINVVLFCGFTLSLMYPPTVIERLARLREKDLPPQAIRYTRKVTIAWSVFFTCNALVATATVIHGDLAVWTLYNGFIAYLLIGLFFLVEYLLRQRLRRRHQASGSA